MTPYDYVHAVGLNRWELAVLVALESAHRVGIRQPGLLSVAELVARVDGRRMHGCYVRMVGAVNSLRSKGWVGRCKAVSDDGVRARRRVHVAWLTECGRERAAALQS